MTSGELLEAVVADNNLTEAIAVGYLSQLLSAADTLHRLKIAHLDIRVSQRIIRFFLFFEREPLFLIKSSEMSCHYFLT